MNTNMLIVGKKEFADEIRTVLAQLVSNIETAADDRQIRQKAKSADISVIIFDDDAYRSGDSSLRQKAIKAIQELNIDFIIVSSNKELKTVLEAKKSGAAAYIVKPYNHREFIAYFNAVIHKKARISCIGGGTGLFNMLLGLKALPKVLLSSIVSMSDEGGSSGRLRASFGILPPGDVRRSLIALSNAPEIMNRVMQYRFKEGEVLDGHSFGNLFLTVLTQIKGSMSEAVKGLGDILNVQGIVIPATDTQTTLCAQFEDDSIIKGEGRIDTGVGRSPDLRIIKIWHEPETECDIDAYAAIINSDIVIIGPGDLFTSVATNLLVKGIREALSKTKAKKVYICNLMTKPGETAYYSAFDHVKEVIKYMGGDYLDYIIMSNTKLSAKAISEYARKDQEPVACGNIEQVRSITKAEIIIADVGHETELVRHDSDKIRNEITGILKREEVAH